MRQNKVNEHLLQEVHSDLKCCGVFSISTGFMMIAMAQASEILAGLLGLGFLVTKWREDLATKDMNVNSYTLYMFFTVVLI